MTLHQLRLAWGAALLIGCGGSPSPARSAAPPGARDPIPRTRGPRCAAVAARMAIVIGEHAPSESEGDVHQRALFELRCETDQWSDEARSCLATISSDAEADGCLQLLGRDQQRALAADRARLRADALE
jgi:2-polyprenyl-6-methoxyphenol hydroxylase-like FAD-dependent oxidoreductase